MDQNNFNENNQNNQYNYGYNSEGTEQSQNNYNQQNNQQNNQQTGSANNYQYNSDYNQSRNFTSDMKNHQYDGLIALFCGILGLISNGIVGLILCIVSIVLAVKGRKFPEQKTYATIGMVCAILGLVKRAFLWFFVFAHLLPFFGLFSDNMSHFIMNF